MSLTTLTQDQQEAYKKFLGFLASDLENFYLFGAAGCGKTFLIRYFLTQGIKDYNNTCKVLGKTPIPFENIYVTATTNKAVEVLQQNLGKLGIPTETIFSTFNTVVKHNLRTGEDYLVLTDKNFCLENALVFVDECSMLPRQMRAIIAKHNKNCKFVYIGDSYQLAPVNEKPYWDNTPDLTTATLYTPVRNQHKQALVDVCAQLRDTVRTLDFKPIKLVSGALEHLDDAGALEWINKADFSKNRILSYTNHKALQYIDLIERQKGNLGKIRLNQIYVNNSHFLSDKNRKFYPEELIQITEIMPSIHQIVGPGGTARLNGVMIRIKSLANPKKTALAKVPLNVQDYLILIKNLSKNKAWEDYFWFKEHVMDLRLPYACTVHKSQGNTYDEVLIDCGSFRACDDPVVAARLLYVAVSRAQNRVLFYGKLPKKYGEFI